MLTYSLFPKYVFVLRYSRTSLSAFACLNTIPQRRIYPSLLLLKDVIVRLCLPKHSSPKTSLSFYTQRRHYPPLLTLTLFLKDTFDLHYSKTSLSAFAYLNTLPQRHIWPSLLKDVLVRFTYLNSNTLPQRRPCTSLLIYVLIRLCLPELYSQKTYLSFATKRRPCPPLLTWTLFPNDVFVLRN